MQVTRSTTRFHSIVAASAVGLSILTSASCSTDKVLAPAAPSTVAATRTTPGSNLSAGAEQQVARFIALALQDPAVRGQVRDAMRASLVDEHKLVLQDFVQTASGQSMLRAAARGNGISVRNLQAQIAALPALDFYMPIRAHRQSWQATGNVIVVATLDRKGPFVGYTTSGTSISLAGKTRDQLEPLFMLHPVEPAGRRVHPQAATAGNVIEDANDGAGSESITWYPIGGIPTTVDLADANALQELAALAASVAAGTKSGGDITIHPDFCTCEDCPDQDGCAPPPPPPPPSDTTLIGAFEMEFCDDDACWTNDEIRITAVYRTAAGVELGRAVYRRGDVNPHSTYVVNVPLIFQRILEGSGQYMLMNLVEEDGFGNNDDWCGDINVYSAQNGTPVYYPNSTQGCIDTSYPYSAWVTYYWTPKH